MKEITKLSEGERILYYIVASPNTYTTHTPKEGIIDEFSPGKECVKIDSLWYHVNDIEIHLVLKPKGSE